jgi:hypothetical protein
MKQEEYTYIKLNLDKSTVGQPEAENVGKYKRKN